MFDKEKLIYLSFGVLAVLGIVVALVLVGKARNLDRQAARVEKSPSAFISPLAPEGTSSADIASDIPEATPSSEEASPSAEGL